VQFCRRPNGSGGKPPSERLWWKQPIDKVEWAWIAIAFVWGMVMFVMMIYWHIYGKQNLSNEAYKTTPEMFAAKAEKFIAENTIRTETEQQIPVVKVPANGEGYLIARLWAWYPILELEKGKTYNCLRWTTTMASRCSRSTSTSRLSPVMNMSSR